MIIYLKPSRIECFVDLGASILKPGSRVHNFLHGVFIAKFLLVRGSRSTNSALTSELGRFLGLRVRSCASIFGVICSELILNVRVLLLLPWVESAGRFDSLRLRLRFVMIEMQLVLRRLHVGQAVAGWNADEGVAAWF